MFRISNLANGSANGATTVGESKFYAQGLIGVSVGVTATRLPEPTYNPVYENNYNDPDPMGAQQSGPNF
jgi:hypothetical protein